MKEFKRKKNDETSTNTSRELPGKWEKIGQKNCENIDKKAQQKRQKI